MKMRYFFLKKKTELNSSFPLAPKRWETGTKVQAAGEMLEDQPLHKHHGL